MAQLLPSGMASIASIISFNLTSVGRTFFLDYFLIKIVILGSRQSANGGKYRIQISKTFHLINDWAATKESVPRD